MASATHDGVDPRNRDGLIRKAVALADLIRRDAPITADTIAEAMQISRQQAHRWAKAWRDRQRRKAMR